MKPRGLFGLIGLIGVNGLSLSLALVALLASLALPLKAVPPELPPIKPLEFKVPKAKRFTLKNQMTVYLLEDHELPQTQMTSHLKTGALYEPDDKIGLSSLLAAVMPYGGTKKLSPDELTLELELMASSIGAGSNNESFTVDMRSLTKNLERTFEIYADLLTNPRLDAKKLDVEKQKTLGAIARRNDEPRTIVRREFNRMLYGAKSPWGRRIETQTIKSVSRKDLFKFHKTYFHPNNVILAVSGDITETQLRELCAKYIESKDWLPEPVPALAIAPVNPETRRVVYLVDKPEAEQSAIRLGHFGVKRHDPDYFALTIMNEILGGGFTSRLFRNVRSRKGLAYSVGSGFTDPLDRGMVMAGVGTKAETTFQAIQEVFNEIKALRETAPTDEEMEVAKNQLINSYIQNFSTPHEIVNEWVSLEFFNYPADWLDNYTQNLAKITKDDVAAAARKYLKPDQAIIVAVGNPKKFDKDLSLLGPIKHLDPETGAIFDQPKTSKK